MMPTITVKNIPADVYKLLKQAAIANHRSINREILIYIERAVRGRQVNPETLLARARQLRRKTKNHSITNHNFSVAKQSGRL